MNPITRSYHSTDGAEEIDFVDIPERTEEPSARRAPHFVPKFAPPKAVKRYGIDDLPEIGHWVVVTARDGKRTITYQGRVCAGGDGHLRLREGAGWWTVPLNEIVSITAGNDPAGSRH